MITLFQHQQQALDLTEGHNRCAYYLDMGLGKTFVGSEKALTLNSRVNLLICQCSKVSDWIDHMVENYHAIFFGGAKCIGSSKTGPTLA